MDNVKMNKQFGTKWFTFYTKVRPWFSCITAFNVIADFILYQEVYTSYWWLMVYFLAALVQPVLCIMVFVKSQGDYEDFVRFVKGVLLFETIHIAYSQMVQQYIQNWSNFGIALVIGVVIFLLGYFLWYRLNMKYFNKRIIDITNNYLPDNTNRITECKSCGYRSKDLFNACPKCGRFGKQYVYLNERPTADTNRTRFCHKCGAKLVKGSVFCSKCGTNVIN